MSSPFEPRRLYQIGLDVGSDSLGWAVFELDAEGNLKRLMDGGVRLFDGGRDRKSLESKKEDWGVRRRGRRRLRAKAWRRDQLRDLLKERGITPAAGSRPGDTGDQTWVWRAAASQAPVPADRLATVLLHLCRHRGFKSLKLAQQNQDKEQQDNETRWQAAETALEQRMGERGMATVGALLAHDLAQGQGYVRARRGDGDVPTRPLIARELSVIRQVQQPAHALDDADWMRIEDLILDQRPIRPPQSGACTLIPEEEREPKALPSAQRARIRMALANLRIIQGRFGEGRALSPQEWAYLTQTLDQGGTHTWPSLRKDLGLPKGAVFSIERQSTGGGGKAAGRQIEGDATSDLLAPLIPGWQTMPLSERDALVRALLAARRDRRRLLALAQTHGLDGQARMELADAVQFGLPRGSLRLGRTALARMISDLGPEVGVREVENRILGQSEQERQTIPRLPELPPYEAVLKQRFGNVTVHIALGQVRLIVNALIKRYGHPQRIVIETTREMKASTEQRREIIAYQSRREKENKTMEEDLAPNGAPLVTRSERLRRWRLWKRQGGICPYTGACISKADLETASYQVDHVIPRAQGGSDSLGNLVLCDAGANQKKGNQTPYKAFGHQADWPVILEHARKALGKEWESQKWRFGPDALERVADDGGGWAPRQIIDTSHIARAAMAYLRHVTPDVVVTRGASTAWLRAAWDINIPPGRIADGGPLKSRCDHRHHFVDAAVIGVTNRAIVQKLSTLHGRHGMLPKAGHPDVLSILGEPFPGFVDQVTRRWHLIWPSLRPDHGDDTHAGGALHVDTLYRALPHPDAPGKLRRAGRASLDDLFGPPAQLVSDAKVTEAIANFVSPAFAERFQKAVAIERAKDPTLPLALAAHKAAAQAQFGPRGIGKISVWTDAKVHEPGAITTVPRSGNDAGAHAAMVKAESKAYLDIVREKGKWKAKPVSMLDLARDGDSQSGTLVMRLRKGDLVAWEEDGKREIGWLRVIKGSGAFFIWPLRSAGTLEAAHALGYVFREREGVQFSSTSFREKRGRAVTITPLGRLRDPGFRE